MILKDVSISASICCHHVNATVYCSDNFYFKRKKTPALINEAWKFLLFSILNY